MVRIMLSEITFCVMGFNTSPISLTLLTSGVHSKGLVVNKLEKPDGITMLCNQDTKVYCITTKCDMFSNAFCNNNYC